MLWGERRLGVRRVQALVSGLPVESATARSYDPERLGSGWRIEHDMLALVAELVDHTNRLLFAFNTKKGTRVPDPIFIPRPGQQRRKRKATANELKQLFKQRGVPVIKPKRKEP